ncbi:Uncharacterised protein [Vibrio cholerae]|nr:Uncharacterised protein [Vibrio cholerae]
MLSIKTPRIRFMRQTFSMWAFQLKTRQSNCTPPREGHTPENVRQRPFFHHALG